MSRKLVLVVVFLAALPVLTVAVKARGDGPPNNARGTPAPRKKLADAGNPFAAASRVKPDASKPGQPKVDVAKPRPHSGPKLHGGEKAILKALKQKTSVDFVETPLKDVLDFLSEKHRIPIKMDSSALKEAGCDESTPVTCNLSGIPLRSALEIILDELQLKWTIHHDVLMITSPTKAVSDEYLHTKCYDVTDLVAIPKDYAVQNPLYPFIWSTSDYQASVGSMLPPGSNPLPINSRMQPVPYDTSAIKEAITNLVATKTWLDNGGTGTISEDDRTLVITQMREVHLQIEQFFADLRARRKARPTLSVELHWLWLDAKQRDHLLASHAKPSNGRRSAAVNPRQLRQIADEVPGFHGQVVCINGIGTAIAAGDRRSIITGAIPVVAGPGGDNNVGYQPVISVPNVGVTAQVRPTFVPGTKTAMLDIVSLITRWDPSRKPAILGATWHANKQTVATNPPPVPPPVQNAPEDWPTAPPPSVASSVKTHPTQGGAATCPIDQPVLPAQQIGTMLRVPLGKPVIVGSITFAPSGDAGLGAAKENAVEVYLIATTSIVRDAAK